MAIGFEAFGVFAEDNAYGMKTDLFVTPKLSVGASLRMCLHLILVTTMFGVVTLNTSSLLL